MIQMAQVMLNNTQNATNLISLTYCWHRTDIVCFPSIFDSIYKQAEGLLEMLIETINKNSLQISITQINRLSAIESIYSSYIEGYKNIQYSVSSLSESTSAMPGRDNKAVYQCFRAYQNQFTGQKVSLCESIDDILGTWKTLMIYKPFLRKSFRILGVRVGNRYKTVHVAPPSFTVKPLLAKALQFLNAGIPDFSDTHGILNGIIFHYLYAFIHPFIDGNGRTARLFESTILAAQTPAITFPMPISYIIEKAKKEYYLSFQVGREFQNPGDKYPKRVDITEFIRYNLYVICESIILVFNALGLCESLTFKFPTCFSDFEYISTSDYIVKFGIDNLITGLLTSNIRYTNASANMLLVSRYPLKKFSITLN